MHWKLFFDCQKDFPAQVSLARKLNANHLHVLTLTFDHPVEGIRNTISSYISTSLTQQKKYWGRPVHIVWADDCWQWKIAEWTTCFLWTSSSGHDGWSLPVSQTWPCRRCFNGFSIRSPKLWCWVDGSSPQLGSLHNNFAPIPIFWLRPPSIVLCYQYK